MTLRHNILLIGLEPQTARPLREQLVDRGRRVENAATAKPTEARAWVASSLSMPQRLASPNRSF